MALRYDATKQALYQLEMYYCIDQYDASLTSTCKFTLLLSHTLHILHLQCTGCMSGFTDAFYKKMHEFYIAGDRTVDKPPPYVITGESCPIWFKPCEVWEVRGADLTLSPVHAAAKGRVSSDRGIALRFPRFIGIRIDKAVEDATSAGQIADMFNGQAVRQLQQQQHGDGSSAAAAAAAAAAAVGGDDVDDDEYL
jgi:DNA ligase 1